MFWFLIFVAVQAVFGEQEVKEIKVPLGEEVAVETPNYPEVPPVGTDIVWNLSTDENAKILLICEDLRISPTDDCEKGYLHVHEGEGSGKFCGSESGLTATSKTNTMKVEFGLIWASGVAKCTAKGIKSEENQEPDDLVESIGGSKDVITIKVGDAAYDGIFFKPLPRNIKRTWNFKTDSNARLSFICRDFKISNGARCKDEEMVVTYGSESKRFCGTEFNIQVVTTTNQLTVNLKTSNERGEINCLVQAITGSNVDQYRNVVSTEMESSEYGMNPGKKSTSCKCGWANKNQVRVVNGKKARNNEYPWMVAIWHGKTQNCGGSIITKYHVLTAAHCTVNKKAADLDVLVGSNSRIVLGRNGQVIPVAQIMDHQYNKDVAHVNDISILVLEKEIKFNQFVGPVCLTPNQPVIDNKYITLMGWGYLGKEGGWDHPEMLRTTHMRVVDFPTCNYKYFNRFDRALPTRICTWASNRDSCMGDSGGPLVWLDPETNRYTQMGLVSFGRGCNTNDPKVNTAVSQYYKWIQDTIKKTKPDLDVCHKN